MKKRKFKVLLSLILGAAVMFARCSSGGFYSDSFKVTPGTVGISDPAFLATVKAPKTEVEGDVVLYYYRTDENYTDWALWAWSTKGNEGYIGYNATTGKVKILSSGGKKVAYWNLSSLAPALVSESTVIL